MGLVTTLVRPETRATIEGPLPLTAQRISEWLTGEPTSAGVTLSTAGSLKLAAVWACVRVISEDIASLPLITYQRKDPGKERATGHRLYRLLHDEPNPFMTAMQLRETMQGHMLLWGNAYANIERDEDGRPVALWPLRPDQMDTPIISAAGTLLYTYHVPGAGPRALTQSEVFHLRGLSSDGIVGYSPITLHRAALSLALATMEYGNRFFGNDSRPGGILQAKTKLSTEAHDRMRKSWETAHQGLAKAHRVAVLEEGVEWKQVGIPPEDAQFLETRLFQVQETTRIFRMPPHKVQELSRATYCLPVDAEIYSEGGPLRIRDIRPGSLVWSRGEKGIEAASVTAVAFSGYERVLTICTTNRTLRVTAKHRVLVRRKVLAPATVRLGGLVTADGWRRVTWETAWVEAAQLEVGDTLVTLAALPSGGTSHIPTRRNVSIGFMEFCGLLIGDGWISDAGVTIARSKMATYMGHYRDVMRAEFTAGDNGKGGPIRPVYLQEQERMTRFSSVRTSRELRLLGLGGDAKSKSVPAWVFRLDAGRRLAFLRGFLDADGSVDKQGRIAFHSTNELLLSQIRHLCIGLGVPVTNMRVHRGIAKLPNGKRVPTEMWAFTCSDPGTNRTIGSHDLRYCERMANGKPFDRKGRRYPAFGGTDFSECGLGLSRIAAIDAGAIHEPVYDLQVHGTASFIANGVLVHNSNIEEQAIEYVSDTLRPWLVRWEQQINKDLLMPRERGRYFVEHLMDALLRGKTLERFQAYQLGLQNGVWSANEVRGFENQNPFDGGDTHLQMANMVPYGTKPEPKQEPAGASVP